MGRQSLAERYEQLGARRDELVTLGLKKQPTPLHIQTVRVLRDLLTLGQTYSNGTVPAPLRAMMRTLAKMEPTLVEELAGVPEDQIRFFLADLAGRIMSIVEVPADGAGPAQPPPA